MFFFIEEKNVHLNVLNKTYISTLTTSYIGF